MHMPIIILAAGQSSRMRGRDKLLEDVDGQPLLRHQALMARAVTSGDVIIALPPRPHPRYGVLANINVTPLPVRDADEGMNASLRAAISALPDCPCVMVLLADLPDLSAEDLTKVADGVDLHSDTLIWRGATDTGKPGHPIIFKADVFAQLTALKGDSGGRDVVAAAGPNVALIPLPGNRARCDLDTPEDWKAWRKMRQAT
ncbi:MAG: nucleotidyltransferase family protein [Sulfitobacter sp.]